MDTEDCINISDEDEANNSSILVLEEIPRRRSLGPKNKRDASFIDLTDAPDDSFVTPERSPSPEPLFHTPPTRSPPLIPDSPSPPLLTASPPSSQKSAKSPKFSTPQASTSTTASSLPSPVSSSSRSFNSTQKLHPTPNPSSPKKPEKRRTATNLEKRLEREEARRLKQIDNERNRLLQIANRANAANKYLLNCTAIVSRALLEIINDPEEVKMKTLFDESGAAYETIEQPECPSSIRWSYKRTEVENDHCVDKISYSEWMLRVIDGEDYLRRILLYRDEPDNVDSLKNYICDMRNRSRSNLILMVYNLANHLKSARLKEAKQYQKQFKDRFEGGRRTTNDDNNNHDHESAGNIAQVSALSIGTTDLQELRLMLELEIKHEHQDWKLHFEFFENTKDAIDSIVMYTKSIAKNESKRKAIENIDLDWAINMDKEKAIDPTKSSADLTKLWVTQLQQFPQVTLPTAKAIAQEYPSPSALLDQYKDLTTSEAEELLAELTVNRNQRRQVGPHISRKIHCFMTSRDPDLHIGLS